MKLIIEIATSTLHIHSTYKPSPIQHISHIASWCYAALKENIGMVVFSISSNVQPIHFIVFVICLIGMYVYVNDVYLAYLVKTKCILKTQWSLCMHVYILYVFIDNVIYHWVVYCRYLSMGRSLMNLSQMAIQMSAHPKEMCHLWIILPSISWMTDTQWGVSVWRILCVIWLQPTFNLVSICFLEKYSL